MWEIRILSLKVVISHNKCGLPWRFTQLFKMSGDPHVVDSPTTISASTLSVRCERSYFVTELRMWCSGVPPAAHEAPLPRRTCAKSPSPGDKRMRTYLSTAKEYFFGNEDEKSWIWEKEMLKGVWLILITMLALVAANCQNYTEDVSYWHNG